jgi:hypothetical protein
MHPHLLISVLGLAAVIATFQTANGKAESATPTQALALESKSASAPRRDFGHLILQVEGNANALRVTRITPKKSGYNTTKRVSPYRIALLDAGGQILGSYPLDLSMFDMNPARIGKPLQVQGCAIRDTRVAALTNVPYFAKASAIRILHGKRVLGVLNGPSYKTLVAQGEVR